MTSLDLPRAAASSDRRPLHDAVAAIAIAIVVLAITWPVLGFDWLLFDDDINILVNPELGGGMTSVRWALTDLSYIRRYLPFGWIGFEGLLAIDGYNATVFHAASWLLSGVNAALMFGVIRVLLRRDGNASVAPIVSETTQRLVAAIAALLWSLHPLRAENAGWISGLLYLGATLFALVATASYFGGESSRRRVLGALLYLASLLVYPVFLSLPALFVWRAACRAPAGTRTTAAWRETRRLATWWVPAIAIGLVNVLARISSPELFESATSLQASQLPAMALSAIRAVAHYLAVTVAPLNVAIFYGPSSQWVSSWFLFAGALLLLLALKLQRTRRAALTWSIAAVISVLPFLTVYDRSFQPNDRYAVLWLAVCVVGVATLLLRLRRVQSAGVALAAISILPLAIAYRHALENWRDTPHVQAVIDRAMGDYPDAKLGYARPVMIAWLQGDRAEMERRMNDERTRFPHSPSVQRTAATMAQLDAQLRERLGSTGQLSPLALLHYDLGRAWQKRGQPRAAANHFARAVQLAPTFGDARRAYAEVRRNTER